MSLKSAWATRDPVSNSAAEKILVGQATGENHVWVLCLLWSRSSGLTGDGCLHEEMKNTDMEPEPRVPKRGSQKLPSLS